MYFFLFFVSNKRKVRFFFHIVFVLKYVQFILVCISNYKLDVHYSQNFCDLAGEAFGRLAFLTKNSSKNTLYVWLIFSGLINKHSLCCLLIQGRSGNSLFVSKYRESTRTRSINLYRNKSIYSCSFSLRAT